MTRYGTEATTRYRLEGVGPDGDLHSFVADLTPETATMLTYGLCRVWVLQTHQVGPGEGIWGSDHRMERRPLRHVTVTRDAST